MSQLEEEISKEWQAKSSKMVAVAEAKHRRQMEEVNEEKEELNRKIDQLEKKVELFLFLSDLFTVLVSGVA